MLSENNYSAFLQLNQSIIYEQTGFCTLENEADKLLDFQLQQNNNVLNVPSDAYVLPPCIYCIHCNAMKFYRESKGFCCSDRKVKLFMSDSPTQLFDLFTYTELSCMEFKKSQGDVITICFYFI